MNKYDKAGTVASATCAFFIRRSLREMKRNVFTAYLFIVKCKLYVYILEPTNQSVHVNNYEYYQPMMYVDILVTFRIIE